jgi:crotonobetainyl-CoA:carnitine CoA-transferase CaiB-like acyl-CoA transferase
VRASVATGNRSVQYAGRWLEAVGVEIVAGGDAEVAIVAGGQAASTDMPSVVLWDFHVGRAGTGYQASAIAGVSWVIGLPGRPPLALQAEIPEKWCGLLGASLALAALVRGDRGDVPATFEVSAAELLRSFADQNAGNHLEVADGWRRNGRLAVEHGGIYPQGFYACADGWVGVVARSKADWSAILAAIGDPDWSQEDGLRDPFALSVDDSIVDPLFSGELIRFTRDELLERALATGATFAPVYDAREAASRDLFRPDFDFEAGALPFTYTPW